MGRRPTPVRTYEPHPSTDRSRILPRLLVIVEVTPRGMGLKRRANTVQVGFEFPDTVEQSSGLADRTRNPNAEQFPQHLRPPQSQRVL
jgi:hypothetical protein